MAAKEQLGNLSMNEQRSFSDYNRGELANEFPQGVTEQSTMEGNKVVIRRIVVQGPEMSTRVFKIDYPVISRAGRTELRAHLTERMNPGVVWTTFHFPESGANVVTTDSSDWATNCPEYKVTAVQVERLMASEASAGAAPP